MALFNKIVSELRKNKYSPLAFFTPKLLARPKPRFSPLLIHMTWGYNKQIKSREPSEEALSTTITSYETSLVSLKIEAKQFANNCRVL